MQGSGYTLKPVDMSETVRQHAQKGGLPSVELAKQLLWSEGMDRERRGVQMAGEERKRAGGGGGAGRRCGLGASKESGGAEGPSAETVSTKERMTNSPGTPGGEEL